MFNGLGAVGSMFQDQGRGKQSIAPTSRHTAVSQGLAVLLNANWMDEGWNVRLGCGDCYFLELLHIILHTNGWIAVLQHSINAMCSFMASS